MAAIWSVPVGYRYGDWQLDTWQKAANFFTKCPRLVIGDECLRKEIRARGDLSRMLDVFNPAQFMRRQATCAIRSNSTMTIAGLPLHH